MTYGTYTRPTYRSYRSYKSYSVAAPIGCRRPIRRYARAFLLALLNNLGVKTRLVDQLAKFGREIRWSQKSVLTK
jgi:hypothetical protein